MERGRREEHLIGDAFLFLFRVANVLFLFVSHQMGYSYLENAQFKLISTFKKIAFVQHLRRELQGEIELFLNSLAEVRQDLSSGDIQNATETFNEGLNSLKDFVAGSLQDINSTIADGQSTCVNVMAVTESIDLTGVQWAVGVTMTIIPALVLACLWWRVGGKNKKEQLVNRCRTWFIFPVFVLMIIVSIILCCCMVIAGLMNSDFCAGGIGGEADELLIGWTGPDATVLKIMLEKGADPLSLNFRAMAWMMNVSVFQQFHDWTTCATQHLTRTFVLFVRNAMCLHLWKTLRW
jgi:hypothetical protein